jgi:predicted nuclease of predicted toxin-antitoxin system
MEYIADIHISPKTIQLLIDNGYRIRRVSDFLQCTASDSSILELAAKENKTIITQDLDFSAILAERSTNKPSIITLRLNDVKPLRVAKILQKVLPQIENEVTEGCIAIIEEDRIRIRKLPIEV